MLNEFDFRRIRKKYVQYGKNVLVIFYYFYEEALKATTL